MCLPTLPTISYPPPGTQFGGALRRVRLGLQVELPASRCGMCSACRERGPMTLGFSRG